MKHMLLPGLFPPDAWSRLAERSAAQPAKYTTELDVATDGVVRTRRKRAP